MYGCDSWAIKKVEHRRIEVFELWCWRRLLRVPWIARWPNQSILKELSPEYSLEGLMLKLKLQYFGHLMQRFIWKDPDAEKDWRQEKGMTEDEMVEWYHWLDGQEFEELVVDREAWRATVNGVTKSRTWLSDWTELRSYRDTGKTISKDGCQKFLPLSEHLYSSSNQDADLSSSPLSLCYPFDLLWSMNVMKVMMCVLA